MNIDNSALNTQEPAKDLAEYIKAVYHDDDAICYTDDIRVTADGAVSHGREITRLASDILASLERYPSDLGATISDRAARDGALIRFNASNRYDNAAIELQSLTQDEQLRAYSDMKFPFVGAVGSSDDLQIIVRVDAKDSGEYMERLDYLTGVLKAKGYTAVCNLDPAGYVRMPGSCVNGSLQRFIPVSAPPMSWEDWENYTTDLMSRLPPFDDLSELLADPPEVPEALIEGVLRRGHKMILSGPSKIGKTFMLMQLSIAIALGRSWLGFPCRRGNVLYVNLEVDKATFVARFNAICEVLEIENSNGMPKTWNLRGYSVTMEELTQEIIRRSEKVKLDAIILDPFYKLAGGDENSASDMIKFVGFVDRICKETGAAVIYAHHHSKSSADRRAIDRASGTTVFARDPDAILDMVRLVRPEKIKADISPSAIPLRMDFVLREFASPQPINLWFEFPLHCLDVDGDLDGAAIEGTSQGQQKQKNKKGNNSSADARYDDFVAAYEALAKNPPVKVTAMALRLGVSEHTIRDWVKKDYHDFTNTRGNITRDTG